MVRIHIREQNMTSYKQKKLITFGGKTISKEQAFKIAISVVEELKSRHSETIIKIENNLKFQPPSRSATGDVKSVLSPSLREYIS